MTHIAEKYQWIMDQLNENDKFSYAEFRNKFYPNSAIRNNKIKPIIDNLIQNVPGLTNLKEPEKNGKFDPTGDYILPKPTLQTTNHLIKDNLIPAIKENHILVPQPNTTIINNVIYHFSEYDSKNISFELRQILSAINGMKDLEFIYKETKRQVSPISLICYQGKWYLLGVENGNNKEYRLCRMSDLQPIARKPDSQQILAGDTNDLIEMAFGITSGSKSKIATIKFYGLLADTILEEKWHPKQKTYPKNTNYNTTIIDIPYNPDFSNELIGRVMRYGELAEILEPWDLRHNWLSRIRGMHAKYCNKTP